jgi:CheY-like chemotaxis protein
MAVFDEFAPQVSVLDIGLPRIDGYELVGRLRGMAGERRSKFVALTGYGQESDIKKALAAGFDAHLTKPAEPEVLLRLLAQLAASPA